MIYNAFYKNFSSVFSAPCVVLLLCIFSVNGQTPDEQAQTRQIIPVFEKARQKNAGSARKNFRPKKPIPPRKRVAQHVNSGLKPTIAPVRPPNQTASNELKKQNGLKKTADDAAGFSLDKAQKIGLTLWKMEKIKSENSAAAETSDARDLVHQVNGFVPERVSVESLFRTGDRVRLSVESPTDSYLYVLNCEVYDDNTTGRLSLIFPTKATRGGQNFLTAGSPIEFPAATDDPGYFEFRPQSKTKKTVAEALIFMVTKKPIEGFTPQNAPLIINYNQLEKWQKKWSGRTQIWESEGGAGKFYTQAEFESAAEIRTRGIASDGRALGTDEPEPLTLFAIETSSDDGLLFTLLLRYL